MFGKKKRRADEERYDEYAADAYTDRYEDDYVEDPPTDENPIVTGEFPARAFGAESAEPEQSGPYDYDDVADRLAELVDQRLDLGSVILPVPPGGQLQVEMSPDGTPQAVHLATEYGRITVVAYAAPKSAGQWRTVAADLAESLRAGGGRVAVENGPWGRELFAVTNDADLRFIGVDGYRWMVRLVAAGPSGAADEGTPLVAAARAILRETIVRRGTDPLPVRDPLPVVLPQELAEQLAAAHQQQVLAAQQQFEAQQRAAQTGAMPVVPRLPEGPRQGTDGSAMQQLGLNN
ncbi:DUF3710 domain-containing protein [Nocardia panacis]|uniref:DUF3710 domain-containing protein n=1 Tax=Nocardia panacis TaxID=2340916 RepID=A0A3A4K6J7_9NOCA|nr:DUF3710 domain-containing protein [Nocardia panacis]RJO72921.1 DUF3710 domain-containing protein [Nocardia panacis]